MRIIGLIYLSLICFVFIISCEVDDNNYPVVPDVEFLSAEGTFGNDLLGNRTKEVSLEFYLIDGDGDVGLWPDMGFPYIGDSSKNYFSDTYYIEDGQLYKDTLILDTAKNFIIPFLGEFGLDNTLKANVIIDYEYTIDGFVGFPYDSIVYLFYVMDRKFHKSNVEWSDTIVFE